MKEALKDLKITKLQEQLVVYKLKELAQGSIGVYPMAVSGGSHPYKKRSKEMEGHNAALTLVEQNRTHAAIWFQKLSDADQTALSSLVLDDQVELEINIPEVNIWINVNDIFGPAADAEDVQVSELLLLSDVYLRFGHAGVIAFVAHKRGAKPWRLDKFIAGHPQFEEAVVWMGKQ